MKTPVIAIAALSAALCVWPPSYRAQAQVGTPFRDPSPNSSDHPWDNCIKRPTRACVLDKAAESAQSIAPPWDRYRVFRAIARAQRSAGLTNAAASSLAVAETILETERLRARRNTSSGSSGSLAAIALEQIDIGSLQSAIRSLDDTMQIAESQGERPGRAYRLAGEAYAKLGRTGEAARAFDLALEAARSERNPVLRVAELRLLADAHIRSSISGTDLVIDRALSTAREIPDARARAEQLVNIATLQAKNALLGDAKATFEQALQAALSLEHPIRRIDTLIIISREQVNVGMGPEASTTLKYALELAHTITDPTQRVHCLRQVGEALARLGLPREAADAFDFALQTAKAERFAGEILKISAAQAGAKMLTEAIASYRASPSSLDEAMLRSMQSPFMPSSPTHLQDSYTRSRSSLLRIFAAASLKAGLPGDAEQYLSEALQFARAITDAKERGAELRQIAQARLAAGLADASDAMREALGALERTVQVAEALPSDSERDRQIRGLDGTLLGIAEVQARTGQLVEARDTLKLARRAAILFRDPAARENGKRFVAAAEAKMGNVQSALLLAMSIEVPEARTRALISISEGLSN